MFIVWVLVLAQEKSGDPVTGGSQELAQEEEVFVLFCILCSGVLLCL